MDTSADSSATHISVGCGFYWSFLRPSLDQFVQAHQNVCLIERFLLVLPSASGLTKSAPLAPITQHSTSTPAFVSFDIECGAHDATCSRDLCPMLSSKSSSVHTAVALGRIRSRVGDNTQYPSIRGYRRWRARFSGPPPTASKPIEDAADHA